MKIIILETSDVGARSSAEAVISLGYEPLFLCQLSNYQSDTLTELKQYPHIDCDTTRVSELKKTFLQHQIFDIAAVVTMLDSRLGIAAQLAKELGVSGFDESIVQLKDKSYVLDLIPEYSPQSIKFQLDQIPLQQMQSLFALRNKIIIKPTKTAGAIGTLIIDKFDDLKKIPQFLSELQIPQFLDDGDWVAQSFIESPIYSIEGFFENGAMTILGYSDRRKVGQTESAIEFPVDESLAEEVKSTLTEAVKSLAERSRFKNGYFHIEFLISNRRPYIMDANMGRVGGGPLVEQISLAYGLRAQDIYAHMIEISIFGRRGRISYPAKRESTYGVLYGIQESAILSQIDLPELGSCKHFQILATGLEVPAMGLNNWSWIGILCGPKAEVKNIAKKISIQTLNGVVAVVY